MALEQLGQIPDQLVDAEPSRPDDLSRLLHRALDQIRAEFEASTWDMFWRATVLGHPTDLIADDHDVSPAAVRQAKSRVLRRLRNNSSEPGIRARGAGMGEQGPRVYRAYCLPGSSPRTSDGDLSELF